VRSLRFMRVFRWQWWWMSKTPMRINVGDGDRGSDWTADRANPTTPIPGRVKLESEFDGTYSR
jgi:hypothetical protein